VDGCLPVVHTSDADGIVELEVEGTALPGTFYLDVRAAGFVPGLIYYWHSLLGTLHLRAPLVTELEAEAAANRAGVAREGDRASILAVIADCVGAFNTNVPETSGITFTLDAPADGPFYFRLVDPDPTVGAGPVAIFYNVSTADGPVAVSAQRGGVRVAGGSVDVRPGASTLVLFNLPAAYQ